MHSLTRICASMVVAAHALSAEQSGLLSSPLPPGKSPGKTLFQRLSPEETGVDFVNPIDGNHPLNRLYASSMCAGGVAVGDLDGDGLLDLFFTNGPRSNRLFHATAPFRFEDITAKVGPVDGGDAWGAGCSIVDIDSDGDLDIYVCNYESSNQLYVNQLVPSGKLSFVESAKAFGLDHVDAGHTPAFCDYDRDGDADLYLMANLLYHPEGRPRDPSKVVVMEDGFPTITDEYRRYLKITNLRQNPAGGMSADWDKRGRPHVLFRNDGGTFTNVTEPAGINTDGGMGLSATWWDYNDDGWPDLYVACDFEDPDYFYRNNGDGTFTDVVKSAVPHIPWFSMGADFGDLNGDGRPDFLVGDMMGSTHFKQKTSMGSMSGKLEFLTKANPRQYMRNALFVNTGTERFMECAQMAHLDRTDWTWAIRIADFDNDGRNDVYFTNGMSRNYNDSDNPSALHLKPGETEWERHVRSGTPPLKEQNFAFANHGDLHFEDVSKKWGLDHVGMSFAMATADFDKDGNLDLVVVNLEEPVFIYRNTGNTNRRALFHLASHKGDRRGLGARVRAETTDGIQSSEIVLTRGYMGCNEPLVHFGFGKAEIIRKLTVHWPSGHEQVYKDLPTNQRYTITEPVGTPRDKTPPTPDPTPLFRTYDLGTSAQHKETPFDDFQREPLLPNKLSQLGPGLAVGDVNGDSREDFFLGGAKGQPGQLFANTGDSFRPLPNPVFEEHASAEDMGALLFDADADGDNDLYVVSGSIECEPGASVLGDRLYLNDGKGGFQIAPAGSLPGDTDSGSCVIAADFDRDGDLDLFIGGRVHVAAYPTGPGARLLTNDGSGKFTDATAKLAPALPGLGMVTAAIWSDANNDGWIDLLTVSEWGSPRLFVNQKGVLSDRTDPATAKLLGWWNGISGRDLDHDGDIDYVVTNFGENIKYHASAEKPVLIYYSDFDQSGRRHIVEAEYEDKTLFPVRGRSCSSQAMPFIKDKFKSFKDFAAAPLADIYGDTLKGAARFECRTTKTGVLRNNGKGVFQFEPLPWMAQASASFGAVLAPFSASSKPDIFLAQNFYTPQAETGHMGNGVGLMLSPGGKTWNQLWPRESGLLIPEDAKSAALMDLGGNPLLLVGVNNGALKSYRLATPPKNLLAVELRGPKGNPTAVGARVEVQDAKGGIQTAEVTAGSGYLAQSSPVLYFNAEPNATIRIRWPDGTSTSGKATAPRTTFTFKKSAESSRPARTR